MKTLMKTPQQIVELLDELEDCVAKAYPYLTTNVGRKEITEVVALVRELQTNLAIKEDDPVALWARIHHLEAEAKGPDGFATWKDAAVDERVRRVKAEFALLIKQTPTEKPDGVSSRERETCKDSY